MRISTRLHGIFDILIGIFLISLPWLLVVGIADPAGGVPFVAGAILILAALLTDFEIGRMRHVPIPVHLWIDGLLGILLIVSPWLFGFDQTAWLPHVASGVAVLVVAVLTTTVPGFDRRSSGTPVTE